jgi:arginyl-tRNA synthetase
LLYLRFHDSAFSLQQLLQQQLLTATNQYIRQTLGNTSDITILLREKSALASSILTRHLDQYFYRSPIAFICKKIVERSPQVIARDIAKILSDCQPAFLGTIEGQVYIFAICIDELGWLEFSIEPRSLAVWLDCICQADFPLLKAPSQVTTDVFLLQYAYARCCSLLHLAARQEIIELPDNYFTNSNSISLVSIESCWLNRHAKLIFQVDQEWYALETFLKTVDFLSGEYSSQKLLKIAYGLSEAILAFYDHCPLFGRIDRDLRKARLGLISIGRFLLWHLSIRLGIKLITEL